MAKQLEFGKMKKPNPEFGGSLIKQGHNPRTKRPLESKLPMHLVLKANQGGMRTPKTFNTNNNILEQAARKHGVRIYRLVNVGNHIHIALKLTHIHRWAGFIREITGRIALYMKKLNSEWAWKHRPYTRIVAGWKKPFQTLKDYLQLNWLEAMGFINRAETKTLRDLRDLLNDG